MNGNSQGSSRIPEGKERVHQVPDARGQSTSTPTWGYPFGDWVARNHTPVFRYGVAMISVLAAFVIDEGDLLAGDIRIYLVFYPFIAIAALHGGAGPGLLATALAALSLSIFWFPPFGNVAIAAHADRTSMLVFIVGNLFLVAICSHLRGTIRQEKETQALLRVICDTAPEAIFAKDREGRYIMANPAQLRICGKPLDAVLGKGDEMVFPDPETNRSLKENDQRVIQSGVAEVFEESVETPFGRRVFLTTKAPYLDIQGRVVGVLGVTRDITERKQFEQDLMKAKEVAEAASRSKDRFLAILSHELRTPLTPALMTVCA